MIDRIDKLGIDLSLSPINKYDVPCETIKFPDGHEVKQKYYKIAGISQLDGLPLYKNSHSRSYKLNYIGMQAFVVKEN